MRVARLDRVADWTRSMGNHGDDSRERSRVRLPRRARDAYTDSETASRVRSVDEGQQRNARRARFAKPVHRRGAKQSASASTSAGLTTPGDSARHRYRRCAATSVPLRFGRRGSCPQQRVTTLGVRGQWARARNDRRSARGVRRSISDSDRRDRRTASRDVHDALGLRC